MVNIKDFKIPPHLVNLFFITNVLGLGMWLSKQSACLPLVNPQHHI